MSLPARLLFGWVNNKAFDRWRCPVSIRGDGGKREITNASTGLELIVASAGNSGSTTLHAVLEAMGVRTWGVEDFAFYLDLPLDRLEEVEWAGPRSPFQACGVKAIVADAMLMQVVHTVIPHSPDAKIVLLTRDWSSWIKSKRKTLARGLQSQALVRLFSVVFLCNWLPYGPFWPQDEVGVSIMRQNDDLGFTAEMLDYCVFPFRVYERLRTPGIKAWGSVVKGTLRSCMGSEAGHTEFKDNVKRSAGSKPYLEAEVRNTTWEDITAFTGMAVPGTGKLPTAKVSGFGKIIARMYAFPKKHLSFLLFSLSTMVIHWVIFRALRSAFTSSGGHSRTKEE